MELNNTLFPPNIETNPTPFLRQVNSDKIIKIESINSDSKDYHTLGCRIFDPYGIQIYSTKDFVTETEKESLLTINNNTVNLSSIFDSIFDKDKEQDEDDYADIYSNLYYKIQLRFQSVDSNVYSQWSSTALVKFIEVPKINLDISIDKINGFLYFDNIYEKETFRSYQIYISCEDFTYQEDIMYFSTNLGKASFSYNIPLTLNGGIEYTFKIKYETISGYRGEFVVPEKTFTSDSLIDDVSSIIFTAKGYNDLGGIMVNLESKVYTGDFLLMRSNQRSNFNVWEEVGTLNIGASAVFWMDITAESGIFYKYKIIKNTSQGKKIIIISDPALLEIDSIFLTDEDTQFLVALNEDVSSFKYVVTDSVTNTIGSKYPFVRRNANTKYKQFNIGGTISFLADEFYNSLEHYSDSINNDDDLYIGREESLDGYNKAVLFKDSLFLSKQESFKSSLFLYENYCKANGIDNFEDYIFEKLFREKAMEFLTNGKAKLFRSSTEGNILVTLTNISFTPEKKLGRRVYSFTATATEIDECNIKNYKKYHILKEEVQTPYIFMLYTNEYKGDTLTLMPLSYSEEQNAIIAYPFKKMEV